MEYILSPSQTLPCDTFSLHHRHYRVIHFVSITDNGNVCDEENVSYGNVCDGDKMYNTVMSDGERMYHTDITM
jgi:hypothetical protein